jgi:hypothetical protein
VISELEIRDRARLRKPGSACKLRGRAVKFSRQPETGQRGAQRSDGHEKPGKSIGHQRIIPQRSRAPAQEERQDSETACGAQINATNAGALAGHRITDGPIPRHHRRSHDGS